jgi:hypothetical protein
MVRILNSIHTKDNPAKKEIKKMIIKKCSPTPLTHVYLHMILLIQIHAFFVYVVYALVWVYSIGTSIGLLN